MFPPLPASEWAKIECELSKTLLSLPTFLFLLLRPTDVLDLARKRERSERKNIAFTILLYFWGEFTVFLII